MSQPIDDPHPLLREAIASRIRDALSIADAIDHGSGRPSAIDPNARIVAVVMPVVLDALAALDQARADAIVARTKAEQERDAARSALAEAEGRERKASEAIESLRRTVALWAGDWSGGKALAWIYGILVGWDDGSLADLGARFLWDAEACTRLQRYARALRALTPSTPPAPTVGTAGDERALLLPWLDAGSVAVRQMDGLIRGGCQAEESGLWLVWDPLAGKVVAYGNAADLESAKAAADAAAPKWYRLPAPQPDAPAPEPAPIDTCKHCGSPVYIAEGFCGICQSGRL